MIFTQATVSAVRHQFGALLDSKEFTIDKTGSKTIELLNVAFIADEPLVFANVNDAYVERELQWYESMSRNVYDIPGGTPKIWEMVSSTSGEINSNYGWCIWSEENYNQFENVIAELRRAPDSRRATMIYTRPNMHYDYNKDGMSDFMCTNTVQYTVRNGKLITSVYMRSNDSVFGYRNDYAWQKHVSQLVADELNVELGDIIWNVSNMHVYERHFYLVDHFWQTGETHIEKKDYKGDY